MNNIDKAIDIARDVREHVEHDLDSCMLKAGKVSDLVLERPKGQTRA